MIHAAMLAHLHKPKHQGYKLHPLGRCVVGFGTFSVMVSFVKSRGEILIKEWMCKATRAILSPKSSSQHMLFWTCYMLNLGNMCSPFFLKVNVMAFKVFCKNILTHFYSGCGIFFIVL